MKFKSLALAAAVTIAFAQQAGAAIILDNFTDTQELLGGSAAGATNTLVIGSPSLLASRVFTFSALSGSSASIRANANNDGNLTINNDTGITSTAKIDWFFTAAALTLLGTLNLNQWAVQIQMTGIDNSGTGTVTFGGAPRGTSSVNTWVTLAADTGFSALAAAANPFSASFSSTANVDSQYSSVRFVYNCTGQQGFGTDGTGSEGACPTKVPAPGGLALLGLGLVGLAALRRKSA